jgi:hypothetical protein
MFFKKALKDSDLIHKLAMKNPRTSEEMLAIANKYALVEEATHETRESKKDKKLCCPDQAGISKSNYGKRKPDRTVANVERLCHSRTVYRPLPDMYVGYLDGICMFHPHRKHKTRVCNKLQGFANEVLKSAKKVEQEKKMDNRKSGIQCHAGRSIASSVAPTPMSPKGSRS